MKIHKLEIKPQRLLILGEIEDEDEMGDYSPEDLIYKKGTGMVMVRMDIKPPLSQERGMKILVRYLITKFHDYSNN